MVDDTYDNDSSLWWPLIDARNVGRVDGFLDNYLDPRQDLRNLQGEYLVIEKLPKVRYWLRCLQAAPIVKTAVHSGEIRLPLSLFQSLQTQCFVTHSDFEPLADRMRVWLERQSQWRGVSIDHVIIQQVMQALCTWRMLIPCRDLAASGMSCCPCKLCHFRRKVKY